jgi:DNA-binding transcriptional ArsR family regulator
MNHTSGNGRAWTFVTNHALVLATVCADPDARLRDIAAAVGITERTAHLIVRVLEEAGYLTKSRDGRRNRYEFHGGLPLRQPGHAHRTAGELIEFLSTP